VNAARSRAWTPNLFAVTAASFIGFTGFTLVMPFLPLYFRQLGVADTGTIAVWAGLSLGVTPALTAALAPLWGRLADRFGRKLMVERSLASFVVVMAAMAFVSRPWHVFALRALQGLFAGYGALTLAMAAESAPRERMAAAIGTVQTAQRLGPALGPVIGGAVAGLVGLRRAFLVSAGFYLVAFVLVLLVYRERTGQAGSRRGRPPAPATVRTILRLEHFALLMGVVFAVQFVDRSFGPILPLYVAELGAAPGRVPLVSGIVFSIAAGAGAVGHHLAGRWLRTVPPRRLLTRSAVVAASAVAVFGLATAPWMLYVTTPVFGAAVGTAMTTAYAAAGQIIPEGARGTSFGVLTTASLSGVALSPVVSGLLAAASIRAVFLLDAAALVAVTLVVARTMSAQPLGEREAGAPAVEEL
jgi:MFS family permease